MNKLIHFTETDKIKYNKPQLDYPKLGDRIQLISDSSNIYEQLLKLDVEYVIFGINENIGAFANRYKTASYNLWKHVIKALINTEKTDSNVSERFVILGLIDFSEEIEEISNLDINTFNNIKKARKLVSKIDKSVTQIIHEIVKAGKKPILIGGGQNNAYGCIKGTALALNQSVNAVNLDFHSDFGLEEGRHNGNGFAYAFAEGFLNKYFVYGLKEINISDYIFKRISKLRQKVEFNTFESVKIRKELDFKQENKRVLEYLSDSPFGVEIDWRIVKNVPGSKVSIGFSLKDINTFSKLFALHKNCMFIHISEIISYKIPKSERKELAQNIVDILLNILIDEN